METRLRIMCSPRAWGFESPLPQVQGASPTDDGTSVTILKFPANLSGTPTASHPTSGRINQVTPDSSLPPSRLPSSRMGGGGGGYMRTEAALRNFLAHCRAQNLKPSTILWYEAKLNPFASTYPKLPLKPELIEEYLSSIVGSPDTIHAYYRALSAFYTFISRRTRYSNPVAKVEPPRRPTKVMPTIEPTELMRLLGAAAKLRDRALLTLLIDTGIRAAEVAALRWKDIKSETILVSGKSGQREVPISEDTKRLLFSIRVPAHDHVFVGQHGPLTRTGVYRIVRRCMKQAGISGPKLGPHRLRHTFGKTYLVSGGDMRSLQIIMGHRDITTTEKYASLTLGNTITKHHKFTPLRAAQAAAQQALFTKETIKEAEEIVRSNQDAKGDAHRK